MSDYSELVYRLGQVYRILAENDLILQGEHSFVYRPDKGQPSTIYIHIDGTELSLYAVPGNETPLNINGEVTSGE